MKLDSNLAWRHISSAISANLDVLLPLAGVFFLVPRLALSLFVAEPALRQGMPPAEVATVMQAYYMQILPLAVPMVLLQALGTLAILVLFTDPGRPTVGAALRHGLRCLWPYIAAELLFAVTVGIAGGAVLSVFALLGPAVSLAAAAVVGTMAYGFIRLILVAPVIVAEGIMDPFKAMRRSWQLTQGNVLRLLLFFGLMALVLLVLSGALISVGGAVAAMAMGAEPARMVSALVSALLSAVFGVYVTAAMAAFHRQLTTAPFDPLRQTFK